MAPIGALLVMLAAHPTAPTVDGLAEVTTQRLRTRAGEGELITRRAALFGLPVRGTYETIWRRAGRETPLATRAVVGATVRPDSARLDEASARAIVHARYGVAPRPNATLVYRLVRGRAKLAWEVALPLSSTPTPSLRTVWIDAESGIVLHERDAVFASHARVFPIDPSSTPDPVDVELATLSVSEPGVPLSSDALEVLGCGDVATADVPPWWTEGDCWPLVRALSDDAGDYFVPLPDIGRVADNRAFDDPYAEVAAYRHVEHFFEVMRSRGLTAARCPRFTVLVNRHRVDAEGQPSSQGGAFYVDNCDPDATPTLLVGQGADVDFAYDADVLHHELGHSVVQQLAPEGLYDRRLAPWGIVSEAGAINEGLGDYFAMTIAGDPLIAEYIGRFDVGSGTPYLRSGDNTAVCPDDLIGEWHSDGRVISGALWAVRSRLGVVVDELVLRSLPALPPDALLAEFGAAAIATAHAMQDEGTLDADAVLLVERAFATRGLLDCPHVIEDPELANNGKKMELVAVDEALGPIAPGPFQLRLRVPEHTVELTLFVSLSAEGDTEPAASFLVKRDGGPIEFEYDEGSAGDTEVRGDHELELVAERLNESDFIAHLPVEPGEVLHVALANRAAAKTSASNFFLAPSVPTADEEAGCACANAPTRGPLWFAVVLGLRRRR